MADATLQHIPLKHLVEAKANPRRDFNKERLVELAADIEMHGVLEPLMARPLGDGEYEIVFGARRFRAAKMLELATVPVLVRDLDAVQADLIRLSENDKRADLHPLERAEGYRRLRDMHKMSVDQISKQVGRAERTVRETLRLLELADEVKTAFWDGKLEYSHARLISQVPIETQPKVLKEALRPNRYGDEGLSVAELQRNIAEEHQVDLRFVSFDRADSTLVPKAGDCAPCPFRLANIEGDGSAHVRTSDICTRPSCAREKGLAHLAREATQRGVKLLPKKQLEETARFGRFHQPDGFVVATNSCYDDAKGRQYGQLLTKEAAAPITYLAIDDKGKQVELLRQDGLKQALKVSGKLRKRESNASPTGRTKAEKEKSAKENQKRELQGRVAPAAAKACSAAVEKRGLDAAVLRLLAKNSWTLLPSTLLRLRFGDAKQPAVFKKIDSMKLPELAGMVFEMLMGDALLDAYQGYSAELKDACELLGVDLKKLETAVAGEKDVWN